MSRAAVYSVLRDSVLLEELGLPTGAVFAGNNVDTPEMRPFIVMRWEEKTKAFADRGPQGLTVWAHDEIGDYTRIDKMIEVIKAIMGEMVHVPGDDDRTVTCVTWTGDSADLYDDGYHTISRNAGFQVVSRAT
jgi:hypothetical protein